MFYLYLSNAQMFKQKEEKFKNWICSKLKKKSAPWLAEKMTSKQSTVLRICLFPEYKCPKLLIRFDYAQCVKLVRLFVGQSHTNLMFEDNTRSLPLESKHYIEIVAYT
jgi:hypothetical protein